MRSIDDQLGVVVDNCERKSIMRVHLELLGIVVDNVGYLWLKGNICYQLGIFWVQSG
jgi:hypothetical protein